MKKCWLVFVMAAMLPVGLAAETEAKMDSIPQDNPCGWEVIIPDTLYENVETMAVVPEDMDYEWYAQINGGAIHPIDQIGIILNLNEHHSQTSTLVSYDKRLRARGKKIAAYYCPERSTKSLVGWDVVLYLEVNDNAGCDAFFKKKVTVVDEHYGEGIENIATPSDKARKKMMDGTLYISTPDGKIFNATGQEVK